MLYDAGMKLFDVEKRLTKILRRYETGALPRDQVKEMESLVAAGEPGVALENLCVQLFEYDVVFPPELVRELAELGNAMGLDARLWERLPR